MYSDYSSRWLSNDNAMRAFHQLTKGEDSVGFSVFLAQVTTVKRLLRNCKHVNPNMNSTMGKRIGRPFQWWNVQLDSSKTVDYRALHGIHQNTIRARGADREVGGRKFKLGMNLYSNRCAIWCTVTPHNELQGYDIANPFTLILRSQHACTKEVKRHDSESRPGAKTWINPLG